MTGVEEKIEYTFNNPELLEMALTHSSFSREKEWEHTDKKRKKLIIGGAFKNNQGKQT